MDMENQNETNAPEKPHKRRIRYSGTHPKTYKEKYKEHQPEKYADMIEHVIEKGGTPAGMHISICVKKLLIFFRFSRDRRGWMPPLAMAVTPKPCWNV